VTARTVVLTFDNLGEAADLERGGRVRGDHPSVTTVLPRLLDSLDALGLRATFFVEGINTELYPDAVRDIAGRGHEIGCHSWQHEQWGEVARAEQERILARCREAFAALGVTLRGFRPPGGSLGEGGLDVLRDAGLDWCSPEGARVDVVDGMVVLPFRWELVDATYLLGHFDGLRRSLGLPASPVAPEVFEQRLWEELEAGDPAVVILHPFVALQDGVWDVHRRILDRLAGPRVLPGGALADELR
jgi:peptidoglycan/xylan/chitin deacetylase (PgdA/CDA1 family)